MGDILKEAIADAKAVRETALQNAKMALEEAFTPQLKSMLSAKLKEDDMEDEVPMDDEMGDEEEIPAEAVDMGDEEEEEVADEMPEEGITSEQEEGEDEVEDEEEDTLDLEAVIKELESEINEEDDAYDEKAAPEKDGLAEEDDAYDEKASKADKNDGLSSSTLAEDEEVEIDEANLTEEEDEDEDEEETVDEQSASSDIGKGDNALDAADSSDEEDPGKGEMHEVKAELKEYKEAVKFLKNKLHEVNILNAKLLFTNKLFKEYSLNNNQKLKVVETFDRAQTTREIKLVYSTLAEQFGDNGSIARKKSISESASSSVGSTKPSEESRKVITEESQVADRFKKLAGLL